MSNNTPADIMIGTARKCAADFDDLELWKMLCILVAKRPKLLSLSVP